MPDTVLRLVSIVTFLVAASSLYANDELPTREQLHQMAGASKQPIAAQLYTPVLGSPERNAIMDAIRLANGWDVKFKVTHLVVARAGSRALAITEVSDASNKTEDGGIFELESLNSQWRPLYSVGGGGGADDCDDEAKVLSKMVAKAVEYADAQKLMPARFWQIVQENKSDSECWGTISVDYSRAR